MPWKTYKFHVSTDDIREDALTRPIAVGHPVGFDDEFFVVTRVRENGDYDVKPHPKQDEIEAAMCDDTVPNEEAMARAWKIGTLTAEEVAALP